jgi:hypothetical protein
MTRKVFRANISRGLFAVLVLLVAFSKSSSVHAAISFDAGGNSQWWFDPVNWSSPTNAFLPPSNDGISTTDAQINLGTGAWDQGDGVVYDPSPNDPFFTAAGSIMFPSGFGRQIINHLYMSRNTINFNKLTIKGDLTFQERVHVGRSSGVRGQGTNALIIQESGNVEMTLRELDLGQVDTSNPGYGNGVYDYRGGTLKVSTSGGQGLRMSLGSNSIVGTDGLKAGPAGIGRFIAHNPATPGHIRAFQVVTAGFAGFDEGVTGDPSDSVFDAAYDSNGVTTGVGIFEFHYENGGTRPIQVDTSMFLHNGLENNSKGIRSSLLDFKVDSAACAGAGCVPNNIGLFDIDFANSGGFLQGTGDLDGDGVFSDDRVFSNITDTDDLYEGDTVSAIFSGIKYNWTISYTGKINWTDANNGVVGAITGTGTGEDIVLIGLNSESVGTPGDFDNDGDVDGRDFLVWQRGNSPSPLSNTDLVAWQTNYGAGPLGAFAVVPEPGSLMLLCVALPLLARRR